MTRPLLTFACTVNNKLVQLTWGRPTTKKFDENPQVCCYPIKKEMIQELDTVVLARDFEKHGLRRDDIGAVVHCYQNNRVFEVEFVTGEGETIALLTLTSEDIRPIRRKEILHARELVPVQVLRGVS